MSIRVRPRFDPISKRSERNSSNLRPLRCAAQVVGDPIEMALIVRARIANNPTHRPAALAR